MPLEMGHLKGGGAWSLSSVSWRKGLETGEGTGVPSATNKPPTTATNTSPSEKH